MRYAVVHAARSRRELEAYMPDNYSVLSYDNRVGIIGGEDHAGWTLDGYVIPRLASGNIWADEVPATDPRVAGLADTNTPADGEMVLVVSAGHGEYAGLAASGVRTDELWSPHGDEALFAEVQGDDWNEERAAARFAEMHPDVTPPDCDLTWEEVWRLTGTVEQMAAYFDTLLVDVATEPGGDDDTYDYWPSAVRLARQIADALPDSGRRNFKLGQAVAAVLAAKGLDDNELNLG